MTAYALFIGLDLGDRLHDWVELDTEGTVVARGQLANRPETLTDWVMGLQVRFPGQTLALGLEQPAAALLHFFSAFAFIEVYALNPGAVAANRLVQQALNHTYLKSLGLPSLGELWIAFRYGNQATA